MTTDMNTKTQKKSKSIKAKIIVKPSYIGNKSSADAFTEIIIRNIDKRKSKQSEE